MPCNNIEFKEENIKPNYLPKEFRFIIRKADFEKVFCRIMFRFFTRHNLFYDSSLQVLRRDQTIFFLILSYYDMSTPLFKNE